MIPPDDRETRLAMEAAAPPPEPAPAPRPARAGQPADRGRKASRRALKNWRVRSRLLLLITIPTLTAVVLGGTRIVSSVQSALTFQRVEQLAQLSSSVTTLAGRLEDERDQTVIYLAQQEAGSKTATTQLVQVKRQYALSAQPAAQVRAGVNAIGSTFPVQVQQDAAQIRSELAALPSLRAASTGAKASVVGVIANYAASISTLLNIDDDIALGSGDASLASSVRALGQISRIEEDTSQQRAVLGAALTLKTFEPGMLTDLVTAQAAEQAGIPQFDAVATPQQAALYRNTVSGNQVNSAQQDEQHAIDLGTTFSNITGQLTNSGITVQQWMRAATTKIDDLRQVERTIVSAAKTRANQLRRTAIIDAIIIGVAVTVLLGLALVLTSLVGRSMVRPLRRLRAGALEIAGLQLPETVRRMSESDGSGSPLAVEPIDVDSADEIGEVARAFDQVHREALRLAANEAALRGNVNAMFVNLSRRSQSLVERQIRLIDELEQGEQDAERLGSLFQMDHLATRMRRNSENLLVLAGHDSSRRWNQPVALVDVLRAAVSEIEQYERVSLNVQPGISARGHAVNDAVHLLAELAENATSFSSAETPVTISGHLLSSGGVLLDITDQGVGMGAEEMAHANWRLDNPPVVDVAVSRRMGLFVVARLAARHGIRVRLRPAASGGLTALVWLPDEVVSRDGASPSGSQLPDAPAANGVSLSMAGAFDGRGADDRAATAQEVTAARIPKFASLQAGTSENGSSLGPRRVPGAGPRPGTEAWPDSGAGPAPGLGVSPSGTVTGPIPAFGASPHPNGAASAQSAAEAFRAGSFGGRAQEPDHADTGQWGAIEEPPVPDPAAAGPGLDAAAASGSAASLGSKLPKRRVDRAEPGASDGELFPTGSTDMFRTASTDTFSAGPADSFGADPADVPVSDSEPADAASTGAMDMFSAELPDMFGAGSGWGTSPAGSPRTGQQPSAPAAPEQASGPAPASPETGFALPETGFALPEAPAAAAPPGAAEPEPESPAEPELAGAGSLPVFSAPVSAPVSALPNGGAHETANGSNGSNGYSWDSSQGGDEVVIPPADLTTEYRLPIFEAVESDWFRRGRSSVGWAPQDEPANANANGNGNGHGNVAGNGNGADPDLSPSLPQAEPATSTWSSPADEGWQAAAAAAEPTSSGVTTAGLPKRVPRANLVPGTAAAEQSSAPAPARSASATRDRLASFQRGVKEGRAAAGTDSSNGEDGSSS
jgi:signal transduction histidine kinase